MANHCLGQNTAKLEDLELKNSVLKVIHSISAIANVLILRSILYVLLPEYEFIG